MNAEIDLPFDKSFLAFIVGERVGVRGLAED
jgi:hypothetical protein